MQFIADLHIHSRYSRATSRDCNPENLYKSACLKGINIVGTGDFTHPGWISELKEKLEPAEEGLFKLKDEVKITKELEIPPSCKKDIRFLLSSEISSIYKKNGKVRKIHNLILAPDFKTVEKINNRLEKIGNIKSDGRPILGLDSRDLLEIALEANKDILFIPAHIWTPHFALFGSVSGFDDLHECFEDLSSHIYALETGLSSDPPMNWRLSALDNYALVSNSDAHSPANLGREVNLFNTDLSYLALRSALVERDPNRFLGTLEFFPELGKYHYDGHRNCGICYSPSETKKANNICPQCGRKLTIGVLARVEELADREDGTIPNAARIFKSLVPLQTVIAEVIERKSLTKPGNLIYTKLLNKLGNELDILLDIPLDQIKKNAGELLAEAIRRLRNRELSVSPGFDGQYGEVRIFKEGERECFKGQMELFPFEKQAKVNSKSSKTPLPKKGVTENINKSSYPPHLPQGEDRGFLLTQLNERQKECVQIEQGPIIIAAGPGTGKTRTLSYRIAYLILEKGCNPSDILAITFTNKAALEMKKRVEGLLNEKQRTKNDEPYISTFHSFCLDILRKEGFQDFSIFDSQDCLDIISSIIKSNKAEIEDKIKSKDILSAISFYKNLDINTPHTSPLPLIDVRVKKFSDNTFKLIYKVYQDNMLRYKAFDYDDILLSTIKLFQDNPKILLKYREQFKHLLVDEFQDINSQQYQLIQFLAGSGENLFVIGDPDQSIYGFRGANYHCFTKLQNKYPDSKLVKLEDNYRSTPAILKAAKYLISHNLERIDLSLKPHRLEEIKLKQYQVNSELVEGITVVKEINKRIGGIDMLQTDAHKRSRGDSFKDSHQNFSFSDFAVLFRLSRQADVLEECFLKEGIPYRLVGQKGFLENKRVRLLISFLRVLVNNNDDFHLGQLLDHAPFTTKELKEINQTVQIKGLSLIEFLRGSSLSQLIDCKIYEKVKEFLKLIDSYQGLIETTPPADIINKLSSQFYSAVFQGVGYVREFKEERRTRNEEQGFLDKEDIDRLTKVAFEFDKTSDFLEKLTLYQDGDYQLERGKKNFVKQRECVSLMTIHAAKGLEFPIVFICGVENGIIPYTERDCNLEEERRLFYVALTRACNEVILLSAKNRNQYGKNVPMEGSYFIKEIPEEFIESIVIGDEGRYKKKRKIETQFSLF
ncbi:MAG: UvrD-helicase domain-containing protein [bacterium]